MAQGVVPQVARVLAPACVPLCLTDGFKEYMTALLTHVGHTGYSLSGARPQAPCPSRAGCPCRSSSLRR